MPQIATLETAIAMRVKPSTRQPSVSMQNPTAGEDIRIPAVRKGSAGAWRERLTGLFKTLGSSGFERRPVFLLDRPASA